MKHLYEKKTKFLIPCLVLACILSLNQIALARVTEKKTAWVQNNEIKKTGRGWYQLTGTAGMKNITPELAKNNALFNACRKALEFHCGIRVTTATHKMKAVAGAEILQDDFMLISNQITNGIVLEKEILDTYVDGDSLEISVLARVKIGKQKGKRDSFFKLDAVLNREDLKNGDSLEITIKSSKDSYITVLNIAGGEVYALFPNDYMRDNHIKAGEILKLPEEKNKRLGITFPAMLAPGQEKEAGLIKVIATKDKFPMTDFSSISSYGTYNSALKKLQYQLIDIPKDQLAEFDLHYTIKK